MNHMSHIIDKRTGHDITAFTRHIELYLIRESALKQLQFGNRMHRFLLMFYCKDTGQDIPERLQISSHISGLNYYTRLLCLYAARFA